MGRPLCLGNCVSSERLERAAVRVLTGAWCTVGRSYLVNLFLVKNILMTKIRREKKSIHSPSFRAFSPEYILWSHSFQVDTSASLLFSHLPLCFTVSQALITTTSSLLVHCSSRSDCLPLFTVMNNVSRNSLYMQLCPSADLPV